MCFLCVFERAFANKRYLETVKVKSPGFSKVLAGSSSRLVGIHCEIKVNVTCCFRDVYIYIYIERERERLDIEIHNSPTIVEIHDMNTQWHFYSCLSTYLLWFVTCDFM